MIRLRASEVAAAVGYNPYKTAKEVILENIQRLTKSSKDIEREKFTTSVEQSKKIIDTLGSQEDKHNIENFIKDVKKEKTAAKCKRTKEINLLAKKDISPQQYENMKKDIEETFEKKIEKIEKDINMTTSSMNKSIIEENMKTAVTDKSVGGSRRAEEQVLDKLSETVDTNTLKQMQELATRHVNTNRGIGEEDSIINKREADTGTRITKRNTEFYTLDMDGIRITGAIDGYSEEEGLIEVKHRRNRFLGMPDYEKVQCEIYMKMLEVDYCTHIERFNGTDMAMHYNTDHVLWENIVEGLDEYKKEYLKVLNS